MNIQNVRELVKKAYPGKKWYDKIDHMNDDQVFAILISLRRQGKIP